MFDDDRHYDVVRNDEDQYSIWPTGLTIPAGGQAVGTSGPKPDCLAYIKDVWTDMRPRSLREAMGS
jgi:MbtH protein